MMALFFWKSLENIDLQNPRMSCSVNDVWGWPLGVLTTMYMSKLGQLEFSAVMLNDSKCVWR